MSVYRLSAANPDLPDDDEYWIAPTAVVLERSNSSRRTPVYGSARCCRGDNEPITIGENSNVQDNSVLHTDLGEPVVVGANVTIGHMVMAHGCVIGDGSLIGMGAIILGRARIGQGCLIAAGTLIPEGREIPDRSVVMGSPGKVVRELTPRDAAMMAHGAEHYVANWRRFRSGLVAIDG